MTLAEEGRFLTTIEGKLLALDPAGNLLLDTMNRMNFAPNLGWPSLAGIGIPYNFAITNGVGASANICNVSYQLQDIRGNPISTVFGFDLYLSDAATGIGLTATTASGGIAAVTADGTILGVLTTSKALGVTTNASGLFVLAITDTAKTLFYPCASIPSGATQVGAQLTTASYHA